MFPAAVKYVVRFFLFFFFASAQNPFFNMLRLATHTLAKTGNTRSLSPVLLVPNAAASSFLPNSLPFPADDFFRGTVDTGRGGASAASSNERRERRA